MGKHSSSNVGSALFTNELNQLMRLSDWKRPNKYENRHKM